MKIVEEVPEMRQDIVGRLQTLVGGKRMDMSR